MNLAEELRYLSGLLEHKLISNQSVGERLAELARIEKDYPLIELNALLRKANSGYRSPDVPKFLISKEGVSTWDGSQWVLVTDEDRAKQLAKRKDEAKNRADQDYAKAMQSIKARHQKALQEAEEMK